MMTKLILLSLIAAAAPFTTQAYPDMDLFIRIVGGNDAEPGDYPYYAQLGGCGGTLIAPDVILTAAHCPNPKWVVVGNNKRSSLSEGGIYFPEGCDRFDRDPDYQQRNQFDNDFALCKLKDSVEIDTSRVKFELNFEPEIPEGGEMLTAIGMGTLSYGGEVTTTLQWVDVPYIENEKCFDYYSETWIKDSMICAGFEEGGKDSCQGDSGGPLVIKKVNDDGTELHTHVGVVSWGNGCAKAGWPGVYARNSARANWIKYMVCEEYESNASFCQQNDDPEPEPPSEDEPSPSEEDDETEEPTAAPSEDEPSPSEEDDETEEPTAAPTAAPTTDCQVGHRKLCKKLEEKFVQRNRWTRLKRRCRMPLKKNKPEKGTAAEHCPSICALVDVGPCA